MNRHVEPEQSGRLEDSIYHQLKRVEQLAADIFARRAGRCGLTQRQYALLSSLSENEGASQADLVRRTGIDRSTLADLAARLEARGFLRRRRCRHDRRANELFLTPRGRKALDDLAPLMAELDEILLSALPGELADAFVEALRLLSRQETAWCLCQRASERACRRKTARSAMALGTDGQRRKRLPAPRHEVLHPFTRFAGITR